MQSFITRLRIANAARLAAASLAVSTLFTQIAAADPTVVLARGATVVSISHELADAVNTLQLTLGNVGSATVDNGVAVFPFLDGAIDVANAKGEIIHSGGLSLANGDTTVTLTDFIITTTGAQPVLTGLVTANGSVVGRVALFDLALPALELPLTPNRSGKLFIRGVGVTLTAKAATTLNHAFNVTAFAEGLPIGTAEVRVRKIAALE